MKLILGNCIEELKKLKEDSVDSIVTDPPYELGFMGKKWDASGIAYNVELWKECLRVLKAGGHLLSFGGTRTYHRMACAIEDAGFEIRDMLEWIYASGFPKSQNVGKAYDKKMGKLNYGLHKLQDALNNERKKKGLTLKDVNILWGAPENSGMAAHKLCDKSQPQFITNRQMEILNKEWELNGKYNFIYEEAEREFVGRGKAGLTKGTIANFSGETEFDLTKGNSKWEGFGTALKPAHEPIVLARKKLSEKTIVENCIKHGTGALDIDGCRIPTSDEINSVEGGIKRRNRINQEQGFRPYKKGFDNQDKEIWEQNTQGRFPANLLVTDDALGEEKSRYFDIDVWAEKHGLIQTPKASKKERGEENTHPTVKPLHLISWLVRLVSKKGDTVLDPFMGSGTTGVACKQLDRNFIGIELNEEYIVIAEKRISHQKTQKELF